MSIRVVIVSSLAVAVLFAALLASADGARSSVAPPYLISDGDPPIYGFGEPLEEGMADTLRRGVGNGSIGTRISPDLKEACRQALEDPESDVAVGDAYVEGGAADEATPCDLLQAAGALDG